MPAPNESGRLVDHLFRHEAGRMTSVLAHKLGVDRLELAEDIVHDAMVQALQSWPFHGIPDNPRAWLYRVATNRALDVIRRENRFQQIKTSVDYLDQQDTNDDMAHALFFDEAITDSQLRMLFAICHPAITPESQTAMCLKILCGLSYHEIANAFLTSDDTIAKRIYRAKEKIKQDGIQLDVPTGTYLAPRLATVLKTVYLLFNEGYNSSHPDTLIRRDLCDEAMRLALLLTEIPHTHVPAVDALLALMCFQTARFDARTDDQGGIVLLADQDRHRWNQLLIRRGHTYLNRSAEGNELTDYHLEAGIAMLHSSAPTFAATNWPMVLHYYDLLLSRKPSPVVALHRSVALAEVAGPAAAIEAIISLTELATNRYYHAVLGDLYERTLQHDLARQHYSQSLSLTTSAPERQLLEQKLARL
ncbi:RNA polymerase sigma factor [Fibrella forsythiae]|uniref:Sigma-70 family RNA polymerase sigma factor n=1 Tax=Fibrella forsythiae TaxID=2817061 RepID=A0ABS3JDG1_9BACT|nr:sigma-70 family RNA polymerase sigma factor [Fibrella forsythiae]MBO0948039.1 sigma-70 family RNA polymerase sigma factor [Fibrella forsythiae]